MFPDPLIEGHNVAMHDNTSDVNSQSASPFPIEVPHGPIITDSDPILLWPYHPTSMPAGFPLLLPEHLSPPLPHHGDDSLFDASEMITPRYCYPSDGLGLQYTDLRASIYSMPNHPTIDGGQFLSYFDTYFPDHH